MDDSDTIKTIAIFTLLIGALLTGVPSYYIANKKQNSPLASYANIFAGGIIFAVGLIHLLPEGSEVLEEEVDSFESFGAVMAAVGYSLMLFLEKALLEPHTHVMVAEEENANEEKLKANKKSFSSFSLAIALVVHSVIEGIAIGLQHDEDEALELFLAVLFHKLPAGLALGVNLKEKSRTVANLILLIFALGTPFGIALGMGLEEIEEPVLEGILITISAGTFIYIACNEIVAEEFERTQKAGLKFALFFGGVAAYAIINHFTHSDDGHDH